MCLWCKEVEGVLSRWPFFGGLNVICEMYFWGALFGRRGVMDGYFLTDGGQGWLRQYKDKQDCLPLVPS